MNFADLTSKSILVTGATSGIGKDVGHFLRNSGANLFLTGRSENKISELRAEFGSDAKVIKADLELGVDEIVEGIDHIDGLVLCAGVIQYMPAKLLKKQNLNRLFDINFFSNVELISELLKKRKLKRNASVVIISSISARLGVPGTLAYAASKGAVESASRVYAGELSKLGIRFNTISPGLIRTPLIDNASLDKEMILEEENKYPLGIGNPRSISSLVRFLLSDESSWLTGENIVLDGGYNLRAK